MIQDLARVGDEDGGVPDAAQAVRGALVEADVGVDFLFRAGLAEEGERGAGEEEGFLCEVPEEVVVVYWGGEGGLTERNEGRLEGS